MLSGSFPFLPLGVSQGQGDRGGDEQTLAGNDGKVDEKEFNDAVTTCKKATQGKKNDVQCKRMVIEIIEENSYKVKTGFFSNWYTRVKREVGMA